MLVFRYEREHNEKLPDFSYMLVGEYGEQNHRPHYHVCFYGLEEHIVKEIMLPWQDEYGYIDVREVKRFNEDPSHDGFLCCFSVSWKVSLLKVNRIHLMFCTALVKSRVCRSLNFGIPDKKKLQSLLSFTLWKINAGYSFVERVNEIIERRKVTINGKQFALPEILQEQFFILARKRPPKYQSPS